MMVQTYNFSTLQWCGTDRHSLETMLPNLNFDLFQWWTWGMILLRCWAEAASAAPIQGRDHWGKQPIGCSALCCQHFLNIMFSHPITSVNCSSVSPASGEKRKAVTLSSDEIKVIAHCRLM